MRILAIHPGAHDASAASFDEYRLVAAVQEERLTRQKGSGNGIPWLAIDEVLAVAGWTRREVDAIASTRGLFPVGYLQRSLVEELRFAFRRHDGEDMELCEMWRECQQRRTTDALSFFSAKRFLWLNGFRPDVAFHFAGHHEAHALPALFFTDWSDALIVTADGAGENASYSIRSLGNGGLTCHAGDDGALLAPPVHNSIGQAYAAATRICDFQPLRQEGRLTGLAAFGKPDLAAAMAECFKLGEDGLVVTPFKDTGDIGRKMEAICGTRSREVVAASIQQVTEELLVATVQHWLARTGARHLGLAGGVFANVRLNRVLADSCPVDEVFVFPAMGDEGLSVGAALSFLLARDGVPAWLARRNRLDTLCLGRDDGDDLDAHLARLAGVRRVPAAADAAVPQRLIANQVGALYVGRAEFGSRALGARSIIASPAEVETNDTLNQRLDRLEFLPFSPVVLERDAEEVFAVTPANRYAARFMTMSVAVRPEWCRRIPAVVHIDGTALPQILREDENPVCAAILAKFRAASGLPVLINTALSAQEQPIVNRPVDCARLLLAGRVDFVVTRQGVYDCGT